jgi:hypothetical protein
MTMQLSLELLTWLASHCQHEQSVSSSRSNQIGLGVHISLNRALGTERNLFQHSESVGTLFPRQDLSP